MINPNRLAELQAESLDHGSHKSITDGACAMEWVSYLAGEGFTEAPECVSKVLTEFTIGLNDRWDTVQRQKLVPYLPRMVGTAGDGREEARSYLALDWLIRTYAPAWLDLAGLSVEAAELRSLPPVVDLVSAERVGPVMLNADRAAAAAWAATGDAARNAARNAAWAAAGAAAWAAAGDTAGSAGSAAGSAAWAAAWAAAGDAARNAAGDTAGDAARVALLPTVGTLQASALDLLDRMIVGEWTE